MFRPVRMERILVGGHRDRMEPVIQTLQDQGVLHLEDYTDPSGITQMGDPLEAGDHASHVLVRVRGLQRAIQVEGTTAKTIPIPDDAAPLVDEAEAAISPIVQKEQVLRNKLADLQAERAASAPFVGLDVDLDALQGLTSLRVLCGFVTTDPTPLLHDAGIEAEVITHRTASGQLAVVAVRVADGNAAERALLDAGFRAVSVPPGKGTAAAQQARVMQAIQGVQTDLEAEGARLTALQSTWGSRLAAIERILEEEVARTQAPLRFAVTENTFHVEGWVPQDRVNQLENLLAHEFGESLYVERLGDAPRADHAAPHGDDGHHHHEHEGHAHGDHHEVAIEDEAPTKLNNPGPAGKYEFLLSLLAMPRYRELDPTKLIAIFFPLFFGLMVGDFVIGLLIVGVALWLRNHRLFGIGGDGVAKPMMWGGIVAVVVGLLVFGEGLGMHLVISDEAAEGGEYSWETAFGFEFPHEGFIHKVEGGHGAEAMEIHGGDGGMTTEEMAAATLHAETADEAHSIFTPHDAPHLSVNGWFDLGIYSKIHDIQALLVWSVLIGVVHLALGFSLGIRNVYVAHGLKLAVQEKVSWLMIMTTIPLAIIGNMQGIPALQWGGLIGFLIAVVLLWQGVAHTVGVGFIAILEIPGLLGNLLSYTRLAAIGASKAGMAVAFAIIGFDVIGGAFGMIFYLLSIIVITLLAILAGFLQSLRLQFVEFFSKFYEGGGRSYVPFGRRAAQPPSSP